MLYEVITTLPASVDHRTDIDYFVIDLTEGETINITVDSVLVDPLLSIDFPGATSYNFV